MLARTDLPPGHQATQAAHALAGWCVRFPDLAERWRDQSAYLILLGVPDEQALHDAAVKFARMPTFLNREPDQEDTATALCIGPEDHGDVLIDASTRRALANLPLLLREPAVT